MPWTRCCFLNWVYFDSWSLRYHWMAISSEGLLASRVLRWCRASWDERGRNGCIWVFYGPSTSSYKVICIQLRELNYNNLNLDYLLITSKYHGLIKLLPFRYLLMLWLGSSLSVLCSKANNRETRIHRKKPRLIEGPTPWKMEVITVSEFCGGELRCVKLILFLFISFLYYSLNLGLLIG